MSDRLERLSQWYLDEQLDFDAQLMVYRYETIKKYFRPGACLEMGPASGVMTRCLINDFDVLHLVDGSQTLLDEIPDYPNVEKFCSLFESFDPGRRYDTIIMEHILEHLTDPLVVLRRAHSWMSDDSVLIAGVPNAKSFHRLLGVKLGMLESEYDLNERDHALGHQRVYDLDQFENDFREAGYKILKSGGVFAKFLSNSQIQETFSPEQIEGFYSLGEDFPRNASDIYVIARL